MELNNRRIRGLRNIYGPKQGFFDRLVKDISHTYIEIINYFKNGFFHRNVYFFPDYPSRKASLYQIFKQLNFNITNLRPRKIDFIVYWDYNSTRKRYPTLKELAKYHVILNYNCMNINKSFIDSIHEKVFGYATRIVQPSNYEGNIVKKNDVNAVHDGEIIKGPVNNVEEGYIYQKLLNNITKEQLSLELRIPYINGIIPYIYYKYKRKENRFINIYEKVEVLDTEEALSADEIKKVIAFCKKIHLDFGELDAIRNKDEKNLLYIIDANNTPNAALSNLPHKEKKRLIRLQATTFKKQFMQNGNP